MQNFIFLIIIHIVFLTPILEKKKLKKHRNLDSQCDQGFYLNGTTCYSCYLNCIECNGIECTKCEKGYYSNEMNCFSCYSNCLECDGKKCKKCINGYYPNNMDCYKCYSNCLECDGKKCTKCIKGYYPNNMDCYKCYDYCKDCDENNCFECEDEFLPFGMKCISKSKNNCNNNEGFYMRKNDYLELINNKDHYFICFNKENIGPKYFINQINEGNDIFYFWDYCNEKCLECNGLNENDCIECDGEEYFQLYEEKDLSNFKCYQHSEKTNYYIYIENSIKYLRKCSDNCLTCIDYLPDKCTSCDNENYFMKYEDIPLISSSYQCFSQIDLPNYYLYNNQYFKECINNCETTNNCDKSCNNCLLNNKKLCVSCNMKDNYYPLNEEYNLGKGYFNCYLLSDFPHYYLNEDDKTLLECSKNCKNCVKSNNHCLTCSEGAYYIQGQNDFFCYFEPPSINWVLNIEIKEWQKCNERCKRCFKQTNSELDQQCIECDNVNYYFPYQKDIDAWNEGNNKFNLTGFNCYKKEEVKNNYYLDEKNLTWMKCSKSCSICESEYDNCIECNYENEYYNIKYHKNGTCFKNPLAGYILDHEREFTSCFRTCKFCQSTSNSFLYMQCKECDEIKYTLANNSYERSYCIPKDNSSNLNSYFISEQLKWYIKDYDENEYNKIYDYEMLNNPKYENMDFTLTYECPQDKPYIIYSIRQCVSKCSNPNDLIEYGLFINKPLYFYNNICYDECPYGSIPDEKNMICIEIYQYQLEKLIYKEEFNKYYQTNVNIYLGKSANNTIFLIQSSEFTNFFYNSSTKDYQKYKHHIPIFDFDECISKIRVNYNIPNSEDIHIGIFQNNDLTKKKPNTIILTAINSTSYKFFLSNGTILDYSICKGMKINVKKPINTTLIPNLNYALELSEKYNLSPFDINNEAFNDICIPLSLNGKDLSIYTRQNKIKSKIKVCDDNCNFLGIDYDKNYSLCECSITEQEKENNNLGDFLIDNFEISNQGKSLIKKSNLIILKCLFKTKIDKKNYLIYLCGTFFLIDIFLMINYLKSDYKLLIDEIEKDYNEIIKKNHSEQKINSESSENNKNNTENNENNEDKILKLDSKDTLIDVRIFNGSDIINEKKEKKNEESQNKEEKNKKENEDKQKYEDILKNNIMKKIIPFINKSNYQPLIIYIQIIIFLLESFLFWNGILNTEEYITKRFDENSKIDFKYILMNEINKSFFTSLILVISFKILRIFYDIKEGLKEIKEEILFEKFKLKTKIKIILIQVVLFLLHLFFFIFLWVFGNVYPNNKKLLLYSIIISLLLNIIILALILLLSSFFIYLSSNCNCYYCGNSVFEYIGNLLLDMI